MIFIKPQNKFDIFIKYVENLDQKKITMNITKRQISRYGRLAKSVIDRLARGEKVSASEVAEIADSSMREWLSELLVGIAAVNYNPFDESDNYYHNDDIADFECKARLKLESHLRELNRIRIEENNVFLQNRELKWTIVGVIFAIALGIINLIITYIKS